MNISLAEAKARLGELVERATAGEPVRITRRGKPIVQLTAYVRTKKPVDLQALRALTENSRNRVSQQATSSATCTIPNAIDRLPGHVAVGRSFDPGGLDSESAGLAGRTAARNADDQRLGGHRILVRSRDEGSERPTRTPASGCYICGVLQIGAGHPHDHSGR
jgi:prevent-host-death family protein